tara:strand:- start:8135 stop:8554 length:420 start_codon:yes stop_codon:yes gene_type:complete
MSKLIIKHLDEKTLINVGKTNKDYVQILINTKGKIVKNYKNKEMQELIKYLLKMCKFIGIKEPPEIDILQMLGQFIKDHWGFYTLKEIDSAIYLAITNNELKHYNSLTPQLLNELFTSYKQQRNKAVFHYRKEYDLLNA